MIPRIGYDDAMTDQHLTLTISGRRLEVLVEGAEGAPGLVFHSGTPSAAVRFAPLSEVAARQRPGSRAAQARACGPPPDQPIVTKSSTPS